MTQYDSKLVPSTQLYDDEDGKEDDDVEDDDVEDENHSVYDFATGRRRRCSKIVKS